MRFADRVSGLAAASFLLVLSGPAPAVAPEVRDEAKFFSPDAIKRANEQIRDLSRRQNTDLLVETFPAPPGDQAEKVKAMSREERAKFFAKWAEERAEARVVRGVCILVCKEPPHVEYYITPPARGRFSDADKAKLRNLLVTEFREKRYDDGLLAAVKFVREKLAGK
ncbi:MAG TPA: TPM domain-containing protein [Gemmataceae bacterium]|nr:TPM domain-containing protein [Gemmataceae bacterium]